MEPYTVISSGKTHHGHIVDVVVDTLTMPNGKHAKREVVVRGCAAAVIPIDNEGNIIFVRQYRHPARKHILEIPAGMLENDEDPYDCAIRELEEETAFKTDKLTFLAAISPSVGFCTESISIYFTDHLEKGVQHLDDDEFVEVEKYSLETAINMIFNGEIIDSKTMIAILMYKEYCGRIKR